MKITTGSMPANGGSEMGIAVVAYGDPVSGGAYRSIS